MTKKVFLLLIIALGYFKSLAQPDKNAWVDSVFQTLSLSKKVSQLFMVPVSAYPSVTQTEQLALINKYNPGGIIITQGGPVSVVKLVNGIQKKSTIPLLAGIHAEWGLGQTLDSTLIFQKPLQLAALKDNQLITKASAEIAREMKLLGLHINFAPNAEIFSGNAFKGSLNYYGHSKQRVSDKTLAYFKGLQQEGILTCAVHPANLILKNLGQKDSTYFFNTSSIDTSALYPYRQLVKNGLSGMLATHISFNQTPASDFKTAQLFKAELLSKALSFNGIKFADIPYYQDLVKKYKSGDVERLAFELGNDVLIDPGNMSTSIKKISRAARRNKTLMAQLNASVKKILEAKYKAGLHKPKNISTDNLFSKLNSVDALLLKQKISEHSMVLLKNTVNTVPIQALENKKFASVSIGDIERNELTKYLGKYAEFEHYAVRTPADTNKLAAQLQKSDVIVIGVLPLASSWVSQLESWLQKLNQQKGKEIIITHFAEPQTLELFQSFPTVLSGFTNAHQNAKVVAEIIFGALPAMGEHPFTIGEFIEQNGETNTTLNRLAYTLPEAVGVSGKTLQKIDAIVQEAINLGATPGANVLVAKDGKVIFEKSYGWLTYENKVAVSDETIYDLASVTKVSATLQTVMFMQERGLIDIHKKASVYLPELKESNKKDFTIKDILTHQAGLWPFLPFWSQTVKDGVQLPEYYSSAVSDEYPYPVADGMFAHKSMKDSLWNWIIKAKVREKAPRTVYNYTYSDMGFYILQHLAEKILNQPMEDFLAQNLYDPLGANTMGFLPLKKFRPEQIAPTENDQLFRKKLLTGYVHDQGAAMHGGIAGHAGLFGTATDLAKLGQMLLQQGNYGGYQFYKPETVALFTTKQYETSRRGLGWDKPTASDWNGPTTTFSSIKTFGHTGFTGTCIWVDPEFNLVFIFLSNRVHPDMTNNKLLNANIRPRIQEVIYKAIFDYRQY